MEGPDTYQEPLLTEMIADAVGLDRVAAQFGVGHIHTPYLLASIGLLVEYGILDSYNYFIAGKSSVVSDPGSIMIGVGIVVAAIGTRYMNERYAKAIDSLRLHDRLDQADHGKFKQRVSTRTKLSLYGFAVGLHLINVFVILGFQTIRSIEGILTAVGSNFVLIPIVYIPFVLEFALTFLGIHFLLPRRLGDIDISLFFYDPRNMGGFAYVGQLLKRSYYIYTIGLIVYFLLVYLPVILSRFVASPYPEPGPVAAGFFTVAWLVGLASIAYSMYRIHRIMASDKNQKIEELEADIREAIENPYDIRSSKIRDQEKYEESKRLLEQVRGTREYPTTFTMWSQIAISVVLPQALKVALQLS